MGSLIPLRRTRSRQEPEVTSGLTEYIKEVVKAEIAKLPLKYNMDADEVDETTTKKWAGATGADFVKATDTLDDITDGTTTKSVSFVSDTYDFSAYPIKCQLIYPTTDQIYNSGRGGFSWSIVYTAFIFLPETTEPSDLADYGKLYTSSDNKLYFKDGANTVHEIAFVA